jgi:oxygen-independent coproporphyrinogen-3 oxidase
MLGLYVHIPFCQAICSYCNFNRGLYDEALKRRYVAALAREIHEAGDGRPADTVFFGGGTPSLVDPSEIADLVTVCRASYALSTDAEITLETNPETATSSRLEEFLRAGITRISFGVQSFNDAELARLGRIHSARRAIDAVAAARAAGCANISLDLMLWLPGQSRESWRATVSQAIALDPEHLSLYLLELYPNAPLKEAMARSGAMRGAADGPRGPAPAVALGGPSADEASDWKQVSDDAAADMYLEGLDLLDRAGYRQYEISNVARPGFASRHNLKYWRSGDWRGFGCGAHSTVDGVRWRNVSGTADYVARVTNGAPVGLDRETLSARHRLEEALFTGLRLSEGIDRRNIVYRFGVDPWSLYGRALRPLVNSGHLWVSESRFGLTRTGMLVANEILATFVEPKILS